MAGSGQVPLALAMIISDAIWTDPGSGKKTILGTFSVIFGREFPLTLPVLAVYLALTDARGKVPMMLRLVDVDELRDPVGEAPFDVDFADPIMIAEGVFHLPNLIFPEHGEYRLQLMADGELIIERRVVVLPAPEESHE
jgi:hypothetical protein